MRTNTLHLECKSKVRYSRNKPVVAKVSTNTSTSGISPDVVELKDMVKALLLDKKSQNQALAPIKELAKSYVTCGGAHSYRNCPATNGNVYRDNIQEFISQASAVNYNQGNTIYRPPMITPLNEHRSAVLLKKFPKKLGDPSKFLIPCDFLGKAECLALADLGASINLMTLSVWNKLSLPDLTPTCMTLELADRLISLPVGVAEDVYVTMGTFHFLADFVVVDFDVDPRVPLILGRSFMKTGRALIDVFEGELTLRVGKEAITFNLHQTSRYSANYNDMTAKRIDVIDMACEEYSQKVLGFSDVIASGNSTPYHDPIVSHAFMNDDPSLPPPNQGNYLPEVSKELKICEAKSDKSSIDEPLEVELKDLPPHLKYAFLEGDDKLPVIIAKDLSVEEKTALITVLKSHNDFAISAVLWQRQDKHFRPIHYASKTITEAESNYTTTEKEMLVVVYAFKKFQSYLIMNKSIEFTFKVIDTKGAKNLAVDHLSRLENPHQNVLDPKEINESFPLETLNLVSTHGSTSWFADFANYHAGNFVVKGMSSQQKRNKYILVAVDYLSKLVKAKVLPTNDARAVCKFLKNLFARFGTSRAIISDRGTHFCKDQFAKVMQKFGVTHRLATPHHPQTSGQVKVSNSSLKRVLERTIGENRASWSDKLDDALWAFRTAYKTLIGCTPYKLVYEKACHLPIELEHKAY
nr:reverse transcriptase domain-containing protein [Tanacetum cinerariifolium]